MKLLFLLIVMAMTATTLSDGATLTLKKLNNLIKKVQRAHKKDVKKLTKNIEDLNEEIAACNRHKHTSNPIF